MSATRASDATAERPPSGLVAGTIPFSSVDGPGNRFVVFMQGCNFDCAACHNPQTIPGKAGDDGDRAGARWLAVGDLLAEITRAAPFVRGITVSGGEATRQPAFVRALFDAVASTPQLAHLTRLVDSNGACDPAVWDELAPVMDGAMIDLKCIDPELHREMTGRSNDRVLASIEQLHRLGRLWEVRLLLVAGMNDGADLLRRTAAWLAAVDPAMRVKVIGFRPHGVRPHDPPLVEPTAEALTAAGAVLRSVAPFDLRLV